MTGYDPERLGRQTVTVSYTSYGATKSVTLRVVVQANPTGRR